MVGRGQETEGQCMPPEQTVEVRSGISEHRRGPLFQCEFLRAAVIQMTQMLRVPAGHRDDEVCWGRRAGGGQGWNWGELKISSNYNREEGAHPAKASNGSRNTGL